MDTLLLRCCRRRARHRPHEAGPLQVLRADFSGFEHDTTGEGHLPCRRQSPLPRLGEQAPPILEPFCAPAVQGNETRAMTHSSSRIYSRGRDKNSWPPCSLLDSSCPTLILRCDLRIRIGIFPLGLSPRARRILLSAAQARAAGGRPCNFSSRFSLVLSSDPQANRLLGEEKDVCRPDESGHRGIRRNEGTPKANNSITVRPRPW